MIRIHSLVLAATLPALSLLFGAGCASAPEEPVIEETTEDLTAAGRNLVGKYSTPNPAFGGFVQLELRASGTYSAKYDLQGAMCVDCYRAEAGRFTATRSGNRTTLRLTPRGGSAVTYTVKKGTRVLTLTRGGRSEYLAAFSIGECNANADCSNGEQCPTPVCLMMNACEPNDPTCCAGTCQPPQPPLPPPSSSCWGAWLDQFDTCRTPADGVYPDSCCANL